MRGTLDNIGGPGEIRTHDLFHAMEVRVAAATELARGPANWRGVERVFCGSDVALTSGSGAMDVLALISKLAIVLANWVYTATGMPRFGGLPLEEEAPSSEGRRVAANKL